MNNSQDWIIWGTGDLCEQFWARLKGQDKDRVQYFVDSYTTGEKHGVPIVSPKQLQHTNVGCLYICSTWFNQIIPVCLENGFAATHIFIVQPRSLEAVSLAQFEQLSNGEYYFVPWKKQLDDINQTLSSDIVHPDVYKELAQSVSYCFISSVEGHFAEFGTCSGYTASLIAYTIDYYSRYLRKHEDAHQMQVRELCLFDSFQGFPEATLPEDLDSPHVASGVWGAGTAKGLNAEQLSSLVTQYLPEDRVNIHEGWYKDTLHEIPAEKKFALVHMDCDLYESTIDVLRYLFSHGHLAEGAMLLFDNWYCNRASERFAERRAWKTLCQEFEINTSDLGMYACVGHRMIIHDFRKK